MANQGPLQAGDIAFIYARTRIFHPGLTDELPGMSGLRKRRQAGATAFKVANPVVRTVAKVGGAVMQVNPRNLIPTQSKAQMSGSEISRITKDMKRNGFDQTKPILGRLNSRGRIEIIDGHHRVAAAIKAGIEKVPVELYNQ